MNSFFASFLQKIGHLTAKAALYAQPMPLKYCQPHVYGFQHQQLIQVPRVGVYGHHVYNPVSMAYLPFAISVNARLRLNRRLKQRLKLNTWTITVPLPAPTLSLMAILPLILDTLPWKFILDTLPQKHIQDTLPQPLTLDILEPQLILDTLPLQLTMDILILTTPFLLLFITDIPTLTVPSDITPTKLSKPQLWKTDLFRKTSVTKKHQTNHTFILAK